MERFTFVTHKLTGQKMFIVDAGIIVARVQTPQGFETIEVNEAEVEEVEEE